jgi:hypothetical protein
MRFSYIILSLLVFVGCDIPKKESMETHPFTNDLISESSPYLLQHAHNPVHWKPYNSKILEQAKKEKKLMIISIGYAACHWCHVMEHETFEDSTAAEVMNRNYISVKVDREERPDVDQIYINAVQLMTGSAGWPLNVITLPDGRPVWGGTYFRNKDWINSLEQIQEIYENEPEKLLEYANRLEEGIKGMDLIQLNSEIVDLKNYSVTAALKKISNNFDSEFGGFKGAPKFMMPNNLELLHREGTETGNAEILNLVNITLEKMAFGGLYDQVEGGFSRYSTDEKWHIPHFEKMLYDNAQLVSLYSNAYSATKNPLYKEVVIETLEFIKNNLTSEEGAFFSSLDADSVNEKGKLEEGAFYVFIKDELKSLLGKDFEIFKEYYNINEYGIWENNQYVLIRNKSDDDIQDEFDLSHDTFQQKKKTWKHILLAHRNKRPKPRLDDKTLTSWNALMLKGYVDAYKVFGDNAYLDIALKNANFLSKKLLKDDGGLYHAYKNNKSTVNGFLEDYAFLIEAYIDLYQVTMDWQWLDLSMQLTNYAEENFFDKENKMFYFTSKQDPVVVTRNFEYRDNVIPASNSVMAKNLFLLSKYFDNPTYEQNSKQMLKNVLKEIEQYPSGFTNWLYLLSNFQNNFYEVVIVGKDAPVKIEELNKHYLPNKIIAGSNRETSGSLFENRWVEDKTLIYVCVNNACQLPVEKATEAIKLIKNKK